MPFYLVTQTSLIEADDEEAAAQKGIDEIRAGGQVAVTVKSDETTISHVVVAARAESHCVVPAIDNKSEDPLQRVSPELIALNETKRPSLLERVVRRALARIC